MGLVQERWFDFYVPFPTFDHLDVSRLMTQLADGVGQQSLMRQVRDRISAIRAEVRRSEFGRWLATVAFLVVLPVLFAVGGAFTPDMYAAHPLIAIGYWVVAVAAFIAFAVLANPSTKSFMCVMEENERLTEENLAFAEDIDNLERAIVLSSIQSAVIFSTRKMVVEYVRQDVKESARLVQALSEMLSPLYLEGEYLFGFGSSEKWNFAVYLFSTTQDALVPVWREKARNHPSDGLGRTWPRGQGHVGKVLLNSNIMITRDTNNPDAAAASAIPDQMKRPYDGTAYRSFASLPIMVHEGRCVGVLVATSDRVGRFDRENTTILAHMADVIAALIELGGINVDELQ